MWIYPQGDPRELSGLVLAYIGDAVYELYVRLYLLEHGAGKVNRLHTEASALVKAASQARFLQQLDNLLTEEERNIAKRGRNAKGSHVPKNAAVTDYRRSTGFEALLGYLFLSRQEARIQELLQFLFTGTE